MEKDGAAGDVIRVRNSKSNIVIQAQVTESGDVVVQNNATFFNSLTPGDVANARGAYGQEG